MYGHLASNQAYDTFKAIYRSKAKALRVYALENVKRDFKGSFCEKRFKNWNYKSENRLLLKRGGIYRENEG